MTKIKTLPIQAAFIADGFGMESLADALIAAPEIEVAGVVCPDAKRCERLAVTDGVLVTPDLPTLLAQRSVDVLLLYSNDVEAILEACAVKSDLPSAIFVHAVAGSGVKVLHERESALGLPSSSVLAPALYGKSYGLVRASINEGRVSSPRFMRWTRWEFVEGSSQLEGLLANELAAITDLMGQAPVRAYAAGHAVRSSTIDYVTATLTFQHGLTAVLDVGSVSAGGRPFNRAMLIGANGSIHVDSHTPAVLHFDDDQASPLDIETPFDAYVRAVEAFIDNGDCLEGQALRFATATTEAILGSIESGRPEDVQ